MRAIVQRVQWARVSVDGAVVGHCGPGLMVLVAAHRDDTPADIATVAKRVANLRIFNDAEGRMNLALADLPPSDQPEILAISNFTLYGDTTQRRPSFVLSAPYQQGERAFGEFVEALCGHGRTVSTGVFGADMKVELLNDGPVTVIVDQVSENNLV